MQLQRSKFVGIGGKTR